MSFLKNISIKIKVFFATLFGLIGLVLFFIIKGKIDAKKKLQMELKQVRSEIEIINLEEKSEESLKKVEELQDKESTIRERIEYIESQESEGKEVSYSELEKFFNDRGL